jgi:HEAT repeat protein
VRLAALAGLAGREPAPETVTRLAGIGRDDPWPEVRARVVLGAPRLPAPHGVDLVATAIADDSEQVRVAGLRAAVALEGPVVDEAIVARLTDPEENPRVVGAAARSAGMRCQESALDALFAVLKKGAEPLAATPDVDAAIAATRAIGAIGGARAVELLERAKRRSNPATDKAIAAAEKTLGRACGNPVETGEQEPAKPSE